MTPSKPSREHGRPPSDPTGTRFWETALHTMLAKGLSHIEGMIVGDRIVPSKLARECGCCRFTAYRWLGDNSISLKGARKIIEISGGQLTKENFIPFLIL